MNTAGGCPFTMLLAEATDMLPGAAECLQQAIEGMPPSERIAQEDYMRLQAQSIADVARDVHLLLEHEQTQNVLGLCRIAFEARINLHAAMYVSEFAAQRYLGQAKGAVDELEELLKEGVKLRGLQDMAERARRLLAGLRADFQGVRERGWKVREAAVAAGLEADYDENYSLLSKAAHNTLTGLAAKDERQVLVTSVVRLFHGTCEACGCLVYFRQGGGSVAEPLTENCMDMLEPLKALASEDRALRHRLGELVAATQGVTPKIGPLTTSA